MSEPTYCKDVPHIQSWVNEEAYKRAKAVVDAWPKWKRDAYNTIILGKQQTTRSLKDHE